MSFIYRICLNTPPHPIVQPTLSHLIAFVLPSKILIALYDTMQYAVDGQKLRVQNCQANVLQF